nr:hypothetical protein [Tanacetum cinerariifolium]
MDVEVEQDDLNQKFLTSLALEWLMHTIVWRNRSDLDTMSLDDLYNHLKVYESEVQKKTEPNSQNMAFISSPKHSSGNEDGNTACVPTASTNVPTASVSVATISQDTACAYIASQSSGSQIKEDHALVADEEAPTEFALMANTSTESKTLKQEQKGVDGKLAGLLTASKDLDNLIESQRSDKNKEGLGYTAVPSPPVQLYLSPKKDLSWTGLPECANDTVTDYSRPSPIVEIRSQFRAPWVPTANWNFPPVSRKFSTVSSNFPTVNKKFPTANRKFSTGGTKFSTADMGKKGKAGSSKNNIDDKGGCKITGNGTIKTGKLKFENLKLLDDANILLRTPRQHNLYSINLNNIVPHKDLTCLVAKAFANKCMLWHRRL